MAKAPKPAQGKTLAQNVPVGTLKSTIPTMNPLQRQTLGQSPQGPSPAEQMVGSQQPRNRYDQNAVLAMLKQNPTA